MMERGIRKFLTFVIRYIASKIFGKIILKPMYKWNPVVTGTDRPKKCGSINESFLQENVWLFCRAAKKKWPWRNCEETVLPY